MNVCSTLIAADRAGRSALRSVTRKATIATRVNVPYEIGGSSLIVIGTIRRAAAIETPKIRCNSEPVVTRAARTPPTMVIVIPILKRSPSAVLDHFQMK